MRSENLTGTLFDDGDKNTVSQESLADGAVLLRRFALDAINGLRTAIDVVLDQAPLRNMETPGGYRMSVAMTNCGTWG